MQPEPHASDPAGEVVVVTSSTAQVEGGEVEVESVNNGGAMEEAYSFQDDEGNIIPPEVEASVLMAMDLGTDYEAVGSSTKEDSAWLLQAQADRETMRQLWAPKEEEEGEAESDDDEVYDMDAVDGTDLRGGGGGGLTGNQEEPSGELGDDAFVEGAWSRNYSTMTDDTWVPETVLARRNALPRGPDGKPTGNMKEQQYKIKWKYYDAPTWEPRTWLEDEGHGPLLAAFDATVDKISTGKSTKLRRSKEKHLSELVVDTYRHLWGDSVLERIQERFAGCCMRALRVARIGNAQVISKFVAAWRRQPNMVPVMVFHGTRHSNIASIVAHGLVIPGKLGVRVANGSAHGIGIYSALTPSVPRGYTGGCGRMFVCAGLADSTLARVVHSGDVRVFFNEALIAPLYLVDFDTKQPEPNPSPPTMASYFDIMNAALPVGYSATSMEPQPRARPIINPAEYGRGHGILKKYYYTTKRDLKSAPRFIKEAYRAGALGSSCSK